MDPMGEKKKRKSLRTPRVRGLKLCTLSENMECTKFYNFWPKLILELKTPKNGRHE